MHKMGNGQYEACSSILEELLSSKHEVYCIDIKLFYGIEIYKLVVLRQNYLCQT